MQPAALTRHVWRYDTVTDDWQAMLSLPAARSAGALVRVGRKLHFFGGVDSRRRDTADHWVLDLRRPTKWVTDTAMPNPRNHLGAIETGGKIYAIGGQHRGDESEHCNDATIDRHGQRRIALAEADRAGQRDLGGRDQRQRHEQHEQARPHRYRLLVFLWNFAP